MWMVQAVVVENLSLDVTLGELVLLREVGRTGSCTVHLYLQPYIP